MQNVVCGLFLNDVGEMLLVKRPNDVKRAGMWQPPSCRVEPGELFTDALKQVLHTKFCAEITIYGVELGRCIIPFEDGPKRIVLFACSFSNTGFSTQLQFCWVRPRTAIQQFACVPSMYMLYPVIAEYAANHSSGR